MNRMTQMAFSLVAVATLAGCSAAGQTALAETSVEGGKAVSERVQGAGAEGATYAAGQKSWMEASAMMVENQKGNYGPFAKKGKMGEAFLKAEVGSAQLLQAGAEGQEQSARVSKAAEEKALANERQTLSDYRKVLVDVKNRRAQ